MKIIPIIKCRDLAQSIAFYTQTLDFELEDPSDTSEVIDIVKGMPGSSYRRCEATACSDAPSTYASTMSTSCFASTLLEVSTHRATSIPLYTRGRSIRRGACVNFT